MENIGFLLILFLMVFMVWNIYSNFKRQKAQIQAAQTMQSNLRPGDEIMTRAGVYGTITSTDLEERKARVEIAPGTVITISLDAVATVVEALDSAPDAPANSQTKTGEDSTDSDYDLN